MTTAAAAAAAAAAHVQLNHRNVSQRAVYLDYSCEQKDSGGKKSVWQACIACQNKNGNDRNQRIVMQ